MPNMTQDMTRVADGIVTSRRQRRKMRAQIHVENRIRHGDICSLLEDFKISRGRVSRENRREAAVINGRRKSEVQKLLNRFRRELVCRHENRREMVAAQQSRAAAFMRDLTSAVASLRDNFAKDACERAAILHQSLAASALDRREAFAIWRGGVSI